MPVVAPYGTEVCVVISLWVVIQTEDHYHMSEETVLTETVTTETFMTEAVKEQDEVILLETAVLVIQETIIPEETATQTALVIMVQETITDKGILIWETETTQATETTEAPTDLSMVPEHMVLMVITVHQEFRVPMVDSVLMETLE